MASSVDGAIFTLAELIKYCLEHKNTGAFQAALSDDRILLLIEGDDAVSDYIRQGIALLGQFYVPDYVSIELEAKLLCTIKDADCAAEQIQALVLSKHLLLSGLYAQDLEYFMSIAAAACSTDHKSELFVLFDPYYSWEKNCYQRTPVSPEEKNFPAAATIVSYTINGIEQNT